MKILVDASCKGSVAAIAAIAVYDHDRSYALTGRTRFYNESLTSNEAEFRALVLGLALRDELGERCEVFSDSSYAVHKLRDAPEVKLVNRSRVALAHTHAGQRRRSGELMLGEAVEKINRPAFQQSKTPYKDRRLDREARGLSPGL